MVFDLVTAVIKCCRCTNQIDNYLIGGWKMSMWDMILGYFGKLKSSIVVVPDRMSGVVGHQSVSLFKSWKTKYIGVPFKVYQCPNSKSSTLESKFLNILCARSEFMLNPKYSMFVWVIRLTRGTLNFLNPSPCSIKTN